MAERAELEFLQGWGWGGWDITQITDERGDREKGRQGRREGGKKNGKSCMGISLSYNLPLQTPG